jgi:hypothetical protein
VKEGVSQLDAAKKLAGWFGILESTAQRKTAPRMEKPSNETQTAKDYPNDTKRGDSVKYMQEVDTWFDDLFRPAEKETDVDYWKRVRNGVKGKLVESFRNGTKLVAI